MADHADVARPALAELPLWAVWRVAYVLGCASPRVSDWFDAYENADPHNRRLVAVAAGVTSAALALAVFVVFALLV